VCVCVYICIYSTYIIEIPMRSLTSRITKYVVTCYLAQGILSVNHCSTYVKVGNLFDCQ